MNLRWCLLLLVTVCLTGCGSLSPTIQTTRADKLVWPVRKVLLVSEQDSGMKPLGVTFNEKLVAEFGRALEAHHVPSVSVVLNPKELNADKAVRSALDEHYPSHQLTVVPSHVKWLGGSVTDENMITQITITFALSELQPHREVWKGEASFVGHPSMPEITDQILQRMVADGILK